MSKFFAKPIAVKLGNAMSKDGRSYRMDAATFLDDDGGSFVLRYNGLSIPLRAGDTAELGTRASLDNKGFGCVTLEVVGCIPATPAVVELPAVETPPATLKEAAAVVAAANAAKPPKGIDDVPFGKKA